MSRQVESISLVFLFLLLDVLVAKETRPFCCRFILLRLLDRLFLLLAADVCSYVDM